MADAMTDDEGKPKRASTTGPFTIIAGAALAVSFLTPMIIVNLPILVSIVSSIVAHRRGEQPHSIPICIGAVAFLLLVAPTQLRSPVAEPPNSQAYKDATWQYGPEGGKPEWARVYTDTDLDLPSPYDGVNPTFLEVGKVVGLVANKGQFVCPYETGRVYIESDAGSFSYPCEIPNGYSNDHLLIESSYDSYDPKRQPHDPADLIKKSTEVTIRVQFFDAGHQKLHFKTAGLALPS